jgi:hypothetical protein
MSRAFLLRVLPLTGLAITARSALLDRSLPAESYDFIVIGGGASGLTVADRLTENPDGKGNSPVWCFRVHEG